ncbi:MAG: deoxyribonuclease IV [Verrucomicrobiales bacterium]|nr:deoxyribonuclease IV [Verrucomicrobiales bacterium]
MRFGAHMSTRGGVWRALERGRGIGCESVQIFVKNNMQWFGKPCAPADLARFANELAESHFSCVFGHAGYLINLGAPAGPNRDKSIKSIIQEIEFATALKLPFLVMHPGAHLGAGDKAGLKQIVAGLDEVFCATTSSPVRIALENTSGQGSCLGHQIGHLAAIYDGVSQPRRLALCLDTAHFLAAGYDIRTPHGWNAAIGEVESLVGLKEILAFHLNDSKTDLGSRVDRHEHIGRGKIGCEGFRHIVRDPRFGNHPGCLETPKSDDMREDIENLAMLRSLAEIAGSAKPGSPVAVPSASGKFSRNSRRGKRSPR